MTGERHSGGERIASSPPRDTFNIISDCRSEYRNGPRTASLTEADPCSVLARTTPGNKNCTTDTTTSSTTRTSTMMMMMDMATRCGPCTNRDKTVSIKKSVHADDSPEGLQRHDGADTAQDDSDANKRARLDSADKDDNVLLAAEENQRFTNFTIAQILKPNFGRTAGCSVTSPSNARQPGPPRLPHSQLTAHSMDNILASKRTVETSYCSSNSSRRRQKEADSNDPRRPTVAKTGVHQRKRPSPSAGLQLQSELDLKRTKTAAGKDITPPVARSAIDAHIKRTNSEASSVHAGRSHSVAYPTLPRFVDTRLLLGDKQTTPIPPARADDTAAGDGDPAGDARKVSSPATVPWPAWVYCTRYSDRPSAGPRSRRSRQKSEDKRPRTAFSADQLSRLQDEFDSNRYLTEERRLRLAKELELNEAQIKIWFQNKRAKLKKSEGNRSSLAMTLMSQGLYNHASSAALGDRNAEY